MTGWKSRTNAGIFIAASDSSAKDKAVADYVCDGVNDEVEVLAAIAALPATGGVIEFAPGTFIRGADIAITKGNLKIIGQGRSTIWKMKDSTNANAQIFSATSIDGIAIEDMIIDGNEANNTSGSQYGINFISCTNLNIDCWIENCLTGDLIVNNIETCGKIKNRNYDDEYMPREKLLLDISGSDGWTVVSGAGTLTTMTDDFLSGTGCLKVEIPASGEVAIEKAVTSDIRFYPILSFITKNESYDVRPPVDWLKITLIDSNDAEVSTEFGFYNEFVGDEPEYDIIDKTPMYWKQRIVDLSKFVWSNNYHILGDIAKIRLTMKGRAPVGTTVWFDSIKVYRGLQRPIFTWVWDDGRACQYDYVLKMMNDQGWKGVCCIVPAKVGQTIGTDPWLGDGQILAATHDYVTWDEIRSMERAGWDLTNHSMSHPSQGSIGTLALDSGYQSRAIWEWVAAKAALIARNVKRGIDICCHTGSGVANTEYYWNNACGLAARAGSIQSMTLPYSAINQRSLTWCSGSHAERVAMLKWHTWAIPLDHDMTSLTDATVLGKADAFRIRGIEVLSFSEVYQRYPQPSGSAKWDFGWRTIEDRFDNLLEADTDHIHAGIVGTGVAHSITTFNAQPDYPRIVTISCTNVATPSGTVMIYGTDARGYLLSQRLTLVAGGMVSTTAAFATVTKVTVPATVTASDTITVGIGDKLGLSHWILEYTDVWSITRNGVSVAVTDSLFIIKNDFVSWESTVDLSTITAGDDVVIRYRTNM